VDDTDVVMSDPTSELHLGSKASRQVLRSRRVRTQDLERHLLVERPIVRGEHHPHAASTQLLDDLVARRDDSPGRHTGQELTALPAEDRTLGVLCEAGRTDHHPSDEFAKACHGAPSAGQHLISGVYTKSRRMKRMGRSPRTPVHTHKSP